MTLELPVLSSSLSQSNDSSDRVARRVSRGLSGALLLFALAAAAGCYLTPTGVQDIRVDINKIKNDVGRLKQAQSQMVKELKYELEQIQKSLEAQRRMGQSSSENVDARLAAIQEELNQLALRTRSVPASTQTADAVPESTPEATPEETPVETTVAGGAAAAEPPLSTPEQLKQLRAAEEEYSNGNYDKAIVMYSRFLQENPDSASAPKAAYKLASAYHEKEDYAMALRAFQYILDTYSASDIVPQTLFSQAVCEFNLNRYDEARETLRKVQIQYPEYEPERIKSILEQLP